MLVKTPPPSVGRGLGLVALLFAGGFYTAQEVPLVALRAPSLLVLGRASAPFARLI